MFPNLRAHSQGKGIVLTFDDDVGGALKKACDYDNDAMHLAHAAEVVRKEIFEMKYSFNGSFKETSEQDAVPPSVMALVSMILDGPSIKCQSEIVSASTRAALSISQFLMFNNVKKGRNTHFSRHKHDREIPLPFLFSRGFLNRQTGDGQKLLQVGNHCGQFFQKLHRRALS